MEAKKDTLISEEKINTVKIEARKDTAIAEEKIKVSGEDIV